MDRGESERWTRSEDTRPTLCAAAGLTGSSTIEELGDQVSRFVARKSTRLTMYMTAIALVVSSVYMVVLSTLAEASLVTNAYPGAAYSWGNDLGRQLGDGLPLGTVVTDPSQAVGIVGADAIAAFGVGTYAHTPSGWSVWGGGNNGELLNGTNELNFSPATSGISSTVTKVAGGDHYVLYLDGGTVFGCGYNGSRALGNDGPSQSSPIQIPVLPEGAFVDLAAGWNDRFAIETDGTVWGWGTTSTASWATGRARRATNRSRCLFCPMCRRSRRSIRTLCLRMTGRSSPSVPTSSARWATERQRTATRRCPSAA